MIKDVRRAIALFAILFACLTAPAQAGDTDGRRAAPFRIPPRGKAEKLTGDIEYSGPSAFAFDSRNRPYFLHTFKNAADDERPDLAGVVTTYRDGEWVRRSFASAIREEVGGEFEFQLYPHGIGSITVDADDGLYVISQTTEGDFLVYSPDLGDSFQAYKLPTQDFCGGFVETRTGHNLKSGPPAIGLLSAHGKKVCRWSRLSTLSIVVPEKKDGALLLEPVEVTRDCFGISNHSGGYSFAATVGKLTHFVYATYDPDVNGNPTWVATFDRTKKKVVARKHLFNAHPNKCDVHSTPVITVDSRDRLHVLGGAHGGPFLYARSRKPNTIEGGWTKPRQMHRGQTYASLVCGPDDTLHSVYRIHPRLLHQSKPATGAEWSRPQVLARHPRDHSGYTIFYHQLGVDRAGRPYVCFTFRGDDHSGRYGRYPRAFISSNDGGKTWHLVRTGDVRRRLIPEEG
ncbi:MAG: BNR-4 repeat-containing protein [Planctomycetota bacterium]